MYAQPVLLGPEVFTVAVAVGLHGSLTVNVGAGGGVARHPWGPEVAAVVNVVAAGAATVKVLVQVTMVPHPSVAVKVTDTVPPHAGGAPVLLLVMVTVGQPPVVVTDPSHVVNAELIAA